MNNAHGELLQLRANTWSSSLGNSLMVLAAGTNRYCQALYPVFLIHFFLSRDSRSAPFRRRGIFPSVNLLPSVTLLHFNPSTPVYLLVSNLLLIYNLWTWARQVYSLASFDGTGLDYRSFSRSILASLGVPAQRFLLSTKTPSIYRLSFHISFWAISSTSVLPGCLTRWLGEGRDGYEEYRAPI